MKKKRILLADDHRIVAEGLRSLIEPEYELVGIVEDGLRLVESVAELEPDVIIVDISMPLLSGLEAVRRIRKSDSDVKVIFLTMHADAAYAVSAFEAGAQGYVLKHSAPSELLVAIRTALEGNTYVSPLLAGELIEGRKKVSRQRHAEPSILTRRQVEVLQLLAEGHSVKEIASLLTISSRTVEYHKYQMMRDIGIKTVAELVRYAVKHGIIEA